MVWEITKDAWALKGENAVQRLRRDVVKLIRQNRNIEK